MEGRDEVINMVNDKNYTNDSAFFGMVNDNARKVTEEARVNDYFAATERAIRSSIKNGDQGVKVSKAENYRFIKERADILRKRTILKLIALITAGGIVIGGAVYGESKTVETVERSKATIHAVEDAKEDLKWLIIEKIANEGSVTFSSTEQLIANSGSVLEKEDFEKLNIDSTDISRIYALVKALGDNVGAINSLASSIGDSSVTYESIEDFCNSIGLNMDEFEKKATDEIYKTYLIEGIDGNIESNEKTKGGK